MVPSKALAPVVTVGVVTGLVTAFLALLVAFGVSLTGDQQTAILGLVSVVAPLVVAYVGNRTTAEFTSGGSVFRGSANEGTTGEYVRDLGELPPDCGPIGSDNLMGE